MKKLTLASLPLLAVVVLVASGCGGDTATSSKAANRKPAAPTCPAAWKAGWQQLANRIHAAVYCPSWVPSPLTGKINGVVDYYGGERPRCLRREGQELPRQHRLAGAGDAARCTSTSAAIPATRRCRPASPRTTTAASCTKRNVPCFSDARGKVSERGITATVYTVNQDADLWHVLYAWHYRGGALHGQRARRRAAHLRDGGQEPAPHAARASCSSSRRPDMRLTRKAARRRRGRARSVSPGSTSSSTG